MNNIYKLFYENFICYNNKTSYYKKNKEILNFVKNNEYSHLPFFVNVYISLYLPENKIKDFIKYVTLEWTDSNKSFFINILRM